VVVVAVTLEVIVAVTLFVEVGVEVTVIEAAVSRQVHTAPTKDDACEVRLLSLDTLGSTARAVGCDRLLFALAVAMTVVVTDVVAW
jgi:hypothetical protein